MSGAMRRAPLRPSSPHLPGLVVGFAVGVATLEFPTVGWVVVAAFVVGAAVAHQLVAAGGALLLGMGLAWISLLLSSGAVPELLGWFLTGLAMLIAGLVVLCVDRLRQRD
jgi:hypothetical protein